LTARPRGNSHPQGSVRAGGGVHRAPRTVLGAGTRGYLFRRPDRERPPTLSCSRSGLV